MYPEIPEDVHAMSAQEMFDFVATHLLTQKKPAKDDRSGCVYRTLDGMKCAVGCLISDSKYKPSFEGKRVASAEVSSLFNPLYINMLTELQYIHDDTDVKDNDEWDIEYIKWALSLVAAKYFLNIEVLK